MLSFSIAGDSRSVKARWVGGRSVAGRFDSTYFECVLKAGGCVGKCTVGEDSRRHQ